MALTVFDFPYSQLVRKHWQIILDDKTLQPGILLNMNTAMEQVRTLPPYDLFWCDLTCKIFITGILGRTLLALSVTTVTKPTICSTRPETLPQKSCY
jgi:hypothetical protein